MAQYFQSSNKRGELFELTEDLNSNSYEKKKEAVKKVIAHMTIGKDVSPLFQPVIKCLEFPQLELKKLVYLYIINYSKTKPDDAIMVVSQFDKDIKNKQNPILRALAVRTMGCVRVPSINQYLAEPLKEALVDPEPYVRMTAALCIPKVYEVSPDIIENHNLIQSLQNMLTNEANAKVLANVLIALNEMSYYRGKNLITITQKVLQKMLTAVNECHEWGQVVVMDYLVNYIPENSKEAEMIVERVLPRLSLINPAVVFSAIKVVIKFMDYITSVDIVKNLSAKISQNLISLISWQQPQIQYVVLKCVPHILQKRPGIMEKNIKVFFCNINEPYYIKNEKLDILAKICDNKNYESVLNEIKEYVNEPDPDFVRRSISSLSTIAIKFERAVDKTIEILVEQMKQIRETYRTTEPYVQEIIIAMQKIYRKYPSKIKHEKSLEVLINIVDLATEEQAKAAASWIIGEYAEFIPKVVELINTRISEFLQEQRGVQLEILTAAIKILLKYPDEGQHFIQNLLEQASYKTENPDVRDRAFIYWRMLSIDTEKVKDTVICKMPSIQEDNYSNDTEFTDKMIDSLGLICAVYSKTVDEMFPRRRRVPTKDANASQNQKSPEKSKIEDKKDDSKVEKADVVVEDKKEKVTQPQTQVVNPPAPVQQPQPANLNLLELLDDAPTPVQPVTVQKQPEVKPANNVGTDLLDMLDDHVVPAYQPTQAVSNQPVVQNNNDFDLFDSPSKPQVAPIQSQINYINVINSTTPGKTGKSGLQLDACLVYENNQIVLKLRINNRSTLLINEFLLQISPNYFGLKINEQPVVNIYQNATVEVQTTLSFTGKQDPTKLPPNPYQLMMAVRNQIDTFFFDLPANIVHLLSLDGRVTQDDFKTIWKSIPDTTHREQSVAFIQPQYFQIESLKQKLNDNRIFYIAAKNKNSYYSAKINNTVVLLEVIVPSNTNPQGATVGARSQDQNVLQPLINGVLEILQK
ncbi:adaptin amine-terminal region family protein (macronuclear) [Tetrahymena thermophila SB210]|uniref:AP complex subunit beta n=1 Tax=Tetrahymena thermophila (strain SB210) TaxID=312017 RepID=I7MFM9_TETTS|nr:adaptin amine-terminal region family protein [Tetrahymena thermophila SB210]EAS00364.2 adaptin amine-terminal region family protein [Tetrahymena thermophila SB210]|eukprot:XP_001020609.2 adaptin amine-terminal region family protein [Tetrahymena thermophila SB210]